MPLSEIVSLVDREVDSALLKCAKYSFELDSIVHVTWTHDRLQDIFIVLATLDQMVTNSGHNAIQRVADLLWDLEAGRV